MKNIAINGFGRIGRNFLRSILYDQQAHKKLNVAVINTGPMSPEAATHLFHYDTILGTYPGNVTYTNNNLIIDKIAIPLISYLNPLECHWQQYAIDWVVDCSGQFTQREKAEKHLKSGARKVLISAPAIDEDITIIPGVNDIAFNSEKHAIVSLGSCTSNAFLPILYNLHNEFFIKKGTMTTIHAYTSSQVLLDNQTKNMRLSRAAALNIIPTSSGVTKVIKKVLPMLSENIDITSVRVPVGNVSLIDFTFIAEKKLSIEGIHAIFTDISQEKKSSIIGITFSPLVSTDFFGDPRSVVIDGLLTKTNGNVAQLFGWYDNEWGYSTRLKDFLLEGP